MLFRINPNKNKENSKMCSEFKRRGLIKYLYINDIYSKSSPLERT